MSIPAAEPRPGRRAPGGAQGRDHGRGLRRAGRAASLCRPVTGRQAIQPHAIPNFLIPETIGTGGGFGPRCSRRPIVWGGTHCVLAPEGPGLGIEDSSEAVLMPIPDRRSAASGDEPRRADPRGGAPVRRGEVGAAQSSPKRGKDARIAPPTRDPRAARPSAAPSPGRRERASGGNLVPARLIAAEPGIGEIDGLRAGRGRSSVRGGSRAPGSRQQRGCDESASRGTAEHLPRIGHGPRHYRAYDAAEGSRADPSLGDPGEKPASSS